MKVKMRGWPPGPVSYLVVFLFLLTGLLNASPVQNSLTSVVSSLPSTASLPAAGYPVPTLLAESAGPLQHFVLKGRNTVAERGTDLDTVKHDYALACGIEPDRKITEHCQKQPRGYYCTSKGVVYHTGKKDSYCESICICVDLAQSSSKCVLSYAIAANCYISADGTLFDSQKQILGHVNQSTALSNGTFDITALSPETVSRREVATPADNGPDTAAALFRRDSDQGVNLKPPQRCIIKPHIVPCKTQDGIVYNLDGQTIGPAADALSLANGALDFSHVLSRRESDITHNFALVCIDKMGTGLCSKKPFEYYCKDSGKLMRKGKEDRFCSNSCECINLTPRPRCIERLVPVPCKMEDGIVYTENGTTLGRLEDAKVVDDGSLDFSHLGGQLEKRRLPSLDGNAPDFTSAIAKRNATAAAHSYALVCGNDRAWTSYCQKSTYGYYCNSAGALRNTGKDTLFCEDMCECVDLHPRPKCILNAAHIVACYAKDNVVYDEAGQKLGDVADALIHPNGTMDFTASTIATRDATSKVMVLHCHNALHTRTCHNSPFHYTCGQHNITFATRDPVCDEFCTCVNIAAIHNCLTKWDRHTSCLIDDGKVYHVNGTVVGDLLGPLDDAVIQADATIDFSANMSNTAMVEARSEAVDQTLSAIAVSPSLPKRTDDDAMDHWVLYCFNRPHTITCGSAPISYRCRLGLLAHDRDEDDFVCDRICHCINQYPTQPCIPTKGLVALCPVEGDVVFHPNGTVLGGLPDAYVHPNGTLEFVALPATQEVSPRSSRLFQMHCMATDGKKNDSLTEYCGEHGYSCAHDPTGYLAHLQHDSDVIEQCSTSCHCPRPFASESAMAVERAAPVKHSKSEIHQAMTNISAPASGVSNNQSSDTYQLNCGNREDGPGFCSSSDLGYFCLANATVVRSSAGDSPGVTWCDYYCTCIYRHPVSCVNEWNIPFCQELSDGTVRDASNLSTVVGTIDRTWVMPNGTLLVDRGNPYIVQHHANISVADPPPSVY